MKIMDEKAAIRELSGISKNAQLWLMDRIGNALNAIHLNNQLKRTEAVDQSVFLLIDDLKRIGLFELQRGAAERGINIIAGGENHGGNEMREDIGGAAGGGIEIPDQGHDDSR